MTTNQLSTKKSPLKHEIKVKVRLLVFEKEYLRENKSDTHVKLKENSTIYDLLDQIYKACLISSKRYVENFGWVDVLWGCFLFKNGLVIGNFGKDGFKCYKNDEVSLKDGDQIFITIPVAGG